MNITSNPTVGLRVALALAMAGSCAVAVAQTSPVTPDVPALAHRPDTTPRVGGSPADEAFRSALRESGARYRESLAECKSMRSAERSECRRESCAELKRDHEAANKVHAEAKKAH